MQKVFIQLQFELPKIGNLVSSQLVNILTKSFGMTGIIRSKNLTYGENGQDWLELGNRQGRSPGGPGQKLEGFKVGTNQIAGTIKISIY